jgi:hypothetical protein
MLRFDDPPCMPGTGETPAERLARAAVLAGTPGEAYLERRSVPLKVAEEAGVLFDADFSGRPALLVPLKDRSDGLVSLHGRYLHVVRGENKMLTIGAGGGVVQMLGGWHAEPLILVEGLFDALSLAACGWPCIATVGRWAPWLPEVAKGRVTWLAFDAGRPGEADAARYRQRLDGAVVRRLPPPPLCKDWNTALVKRGPGIVTRWVRDRISEVHPGHD